jgi:hypothetical protein
MPSDPWSLPGDPNYNYNASYGDYATGGYIPGPSDWDGTIWAGAQPPSFHASYEDSLPPLPDFQGPALDVPYQPYMQYGEFPITDVGDDTFHNTAPVPTNDWDFQWYGNPPQFLPDPLPPIPGNEPPTWESLFTPGWWSQLNYEIGEGRFNQPPVDSNNFWDTFDGNDWGSW